jgi:hypothetical protein
VNETEWSEMLLERQATLQKQLRAVRRELQHARDSRDTWRNRAKAAERDTDQSLRGEIAQLEAKLAKQDKLLEEARFLNEIARMNAQRRGANREGDSTRGSKSEVAAA